MYESPKEEESAVVLYRKPKPFYKKDSRLNNRLTNSTDISSEGEDLVTRNNLEAFTSQIISSFTPSTMTQQHLEYQILLATSKKEDLPLLSSLPQGAPVRSLADLLPSQAGTYHIQEKENDTGLSKQRYIVKMFTTTITQLPDSCQLDQLPTHDDCKGNEAGILYSVSNNVRSSKVNALIDGGANGGIAGSADSR